MTNVFKVLKLDTTEEEKMKTAWGGGLGDWKERW